MSLNVNASPFQSSSAASSMSSTDYVIDMPHDVMLDYVFPYTIQTDYIKEEPVHPLLGVSHSSLSKKTPSYTSYILTRQSNGLYVPIYNYEVPPWSSIFSRL